MRFSINIIFDQYWGMVQICKDKKHRCIQRLHWNVKLEQQVHQWLVH